MGIPFPILSRTPTPATWKESALIDPTIRTEFVSGAIATRARFTKPAPRKLSFTYNLLTQEDKELLEGHEDDVNIGASIFTFKNSQSGEYWDVRYLTPINFGIDERTYPPRWFANIELFGKQVEKMRTEMYAVEDLDAGADLTNVPVFVNPKAVTINSIGILTQGSDAGIDDSNTAVILVEDDASNALVTKTYNTATKPPDSDYVDLGALSNSSLDAGEHLMLTVTQGTNANLSAFILIIEYYYT